MSTRQTVTIQGPADRDQIARWARNVETGTVVTFRKKSRSSEQSAKMWAMLNEVADQVEWYGAKLDAEDWKDVFTASLRHARVVPGIDKGTYVPLGMHTSTLTIEEMKKALVRYSPIMPIDAALSDALTAALSLLPGKPVGWRWKLPSDDFWQFKNGPERPRLGLPTRTEAAAIIEPVYAAPAPQPVSERIIAAARAVIAQWETPNWKLVEPTTKLINELRSALSSPVEGGTEKEADIDTCPVCSEPLKANDLCSTDIELGVCHAAWAIRFSRLEFTKIHLSPNRAKRLTGPGHDQRK